MSEEKKTIYKDDFFKDRNEQTEYSARRILEVVTEVCPELSSMRSAVDLGCGVGTWLKQFSELTGSDDVRGYDGDYVNVDLMMIPKDHFTPFDLKERIPQERRYDLAISMEVAEHLPKSRADSFVEDLCSLSDHVLFSAATVYQGGTGHINEQRLSYWVEKFAALGYEPLDVIRFRIWEDEKILPWYKQNVILFRKSTKDRAEYMPVKDLIHPEIFEMAMSEWKAERSKPYFRFYYKMQRLKGRFKGRKQK